MDLSLDDALDILKLLASVGASVASDDAQKLGLLVSIEASLFAA